MYIRLQRRSWVERCLRLPLLWHQRYTILAQRMQRWQAAQLAVILAGLSVRE